VSTVTRRPARAALGDARASGSRTLSPRGRRRLGYALLAALSYVPVLLTAPGKVAADTKQYLYLDPGRMLGRASSMWDPNIGMGTVTHQNIGYLFPMGPFYWIFDRLAVPDWVAQRVWLGTILFAAGLGMLYLLRTLGMRGPGVVVGTLAFMLSPYSLDYAARISVILLPWAGLPWMLALTVRALRQGGWRYPALFAIVIQVVGGVNATALVYAAIAPLLWIPYSVWVAREVPGRRALASTARIGLLTLATSLWWMAGLWAQGSYGLNILKYTETVQAVAKTSLAPEVLRGLGYWFFYGQDKIGSWIEAGKNYTQWPWLIVVSYLVPSLALLSAVFVRWRHRAYFVFLALVGVALAVGANPYDNPSPLGALFKAFAEGSTAGLAMRSTGRATPLVVLGLAVLLAAGVNAFAAHLAGRRDARRGLLVAGLVGALVIVNLPALWNGTFYGKNLQRPEAIPRYWTDAARYLDAQPHDTRVLELPGSDFASYRWGNTVDPITPGLMDRPYVARELIPYGSPASADLLNALDRRLQEGLFEPAALAPIARLMSAGDIVLRDDIQTDRYNLIRPRALWHFFRPPPPGLDAPKTFGTTIPGAPKYPQIDEQALAFPPGEKAPPPVAVFPVSGVPSIVRSVPTAAPVLVAGDGEGVVDAAALGLLDGNHLMLYSASFGSDRAGLRAAAGESGATLVVTDTNRRRARRWSGVRDNLGYTEQAGEQPLVKDPGDARLDVFPDAGDNAFTTTEQHGVKTVQASHYGNPVSYTAEDRPVRAFDGDPFTAWKVGAFAPVNGERLRVELERPITTDHVLLQQPQNGPRDRFITRVTLHFDGGHAVTRDLGPVSRGTTGETVTFPRRTFRSFEITIDQTNLPRQFVYAGVSAVGFAEVGLRDDRPGATDVRIDEVIRMPSDLLDAAGRSSLAHPLTLVMTRDRVIPVPPRYDPELGLARSFRLPTERSFTVSGTVRLNPAASDPTLDGLVGLPGPEAGGILARSSEHLFGDVRSRASSAIDGNPATAWNTPFVGVNQQWVDYTLPRPITFDHLDLQVVADGRHSVPTKLAVQADGGPIRTVDVPPIADQQHENVTAAVPVRFEPITGRNIRVTIEGVRPVQTLEFFRAADVVMPVGIAELGIPGVQRAPEPAQLPPSCRTDLVTMDGRPLPVRLVGTTAAAETRGALDVELCDPRSPGSPPLALSAGEHVLRTALGGTSGIDFDRLVLSSIIGGGPVPNHAVGGSLLGPTAPSAHVVKSGRTSMTVRVDHPREPFTLVLGQSLNSGWTAKADGRSLGAPRLVDAYANGWRVQPASDGRNLDITLDWAPQHAVNVALVMSAVAFACCLGIAVVTGVRRRRRGRTVTPAGAPAPQPEDTAPEFMFPFVAAGQRPSPLVLVLGVLVSALGAGALVRPWAGVLVGAVVAVVLIRPRMRWLLTLFPPAALMLSGVFIMVKQVHGNWPPVFEWPTLFWQVRTLGWLAIVALAADALVELLRRGRANRARPDAGLAREAASRAAGRTNAAEGDGAAPA
jgi:arabinofuranan 3-O-arabinosyltransferase